MDNTHHRTRGSPEFPDFFRYWGKAGSGMEFHCLVYHSLDVAACAQALLHKLPSWRRRLERVTGIEGTTLEQAVAFYVALHDLGKYTEGFQGLRPDLFQRFWGRKPKKSYVERHDVLGFLLWRLALRPALEEAGLAPKQRMTFDDLDQWLLVATGHHGQPPHVKGYLLRDLCDESRDISAALNFVHALRQLFLDDGPLPRLNGKAQRRQWQKGSWWLAGLTVLSDWLGSNRNFFPYETKVQSLEEYWSVACYRAKQMVSAAGLDPDEPAEHFGLADCLPDIPAHHLHATPLQSRAQKLPLKESPMFVVLEDLTGSGKTEAALLLVHRLMQRKQAGGLYIGLPTMATANGMYRRLGRVYRRLYAPTGVPSLALTHARAELVKDFRQNILPMQSTEPGYRDEATPAEAQCAAWLADSRKKALLAEVGVGTVDQGLMAVLPSRHQSLRLLGLMDKVLVVDEVHACDDYMRELLKALLLAQAQVGASVILLSATLPQKQRRDLLTAYAKGAGWPEPELQKSNEDDYPLLTRLDEDGLHEEMMGTRPSVRRHVGISTLGSSQAVEEVITRAVAAGHCVCWVRNTVGEAVESWQQLAISYPERAIELFHARYTVTDRLDIENRVLVRFGKKSTARDRRGQVLVATQVVEQSLDLDFDVLITDLAPIDLLIQRTGRLQRHARDGKGNRLRDPGAQDQREDPVLYIHAPPWTDTPDQNWLRCALPGTSHVYTDHGRLWLSLKLLKAAKGFSMPQDARRLMEGVYGEEAVDQIPVELMEVTLEAEGEAKSKKGMAQLKALNLDQGYRATGSWLDEDAAPTRLGEPTITMYLARRLNAQVYPLHTEQIDNLSWIESSITVRRAEARQDIRPPDVDEATWNTWKEALPSKGRWGLLVILEKEEADWKGQVEDEYARQRLVLYNHATGLSISKFH